VLKERSVRSIVRPPARTGKDRTRRIEVMKILHTNRGRLRKDRPESFMLIEVAIKLIAPNKEEIPAICKLRIARSTLPPLWESIPERGGYRVQPVPAPKSTREEHTTRTREEGRSQKLILFNLGKAISGAPIITGNNQLPKVPRRIGITIKNIIRIAWEVTITLYW
jgi:hypothetical protein